MVEKTKKHISQDENMVIESNESLTLVESFDELRLNEQLLRGLYAYGFDKPSAVQKRAILPIIKRRDVIVQS